MPKSGIVVVVVVVLHIKNRSGLRSVPSNVRTGPTDADVFRGHKLTCPKGGYTFLKNVTGHQKKKSSKTLSENKAKKQLRKKVTYLGTGNRRSYLVKKV